jgi:phage shock protein A
MAAAGLEKFSHLEDKIYRTVELCKVLKQEKEDRERELGAARRELEMLNAEKEELLDKVARLQADRDKMRLKVEAMLDAVAVLEMEAEAGKR